jgi:hypothetical protein
MRGPDLRLMALLSLVLDRVQIEFEKEADEAYIGANSLYKGSKSQFRGS